MGAAASWYRVWGRERKRNRRGLVRRRGDWHHAQPCAAKTAARRDAQANESACRRTPHRRAVHDRVFRNVAKRPPKAARGECGPVSTFVVQDRKSTRLNSSHGYISYAVFCLKK